MRIAVVQHNEIAPLGLFAQHLPAATTVVHLERGDALPDPRDYDGLVVLGGIMGAYDTSEYPMLLDEKEMLRQAFAADVPVLGICLGCQLLADALGGAAYRAPRIELRFEPCRLTVAGAADPVAQHFAQPVLSFHQDTWDLPPGGELLAESAQYPQAFRIGSAVGVQPHPEVTPEIVAGWIGEFDPVSLAQADADPADVLEAMRLHRAASGETAGKLIAGWLADVR
ncbi:MAG TPA: type 1 glutamine amidotransferase [Acidimicrobiia bacterium]|jgi:GMP synthase (glutamine-hydrolysing)|nr:type 1 glutamine amidotransferase [Acidimicrobiia bacterium]